MLRPSELPLLSELTALCGDPASLDASVEWFVPGLKPPRLEGDEDDDGFGFRSLIEQPEALQDAWRTTGRERSGHRAGRAKRRRRSHEDRVLREQQPWRETPYGMALEATEVDVSTLFQRDDARAT